MFAPIEVRERKKVKSIIGALTRRSMTTNAVRDTAARTSSEITRAEPQCQLLLWTSASTSAVSPTVSVAIPAKSTVLSTVSSRDSRAANSVTAIATTAIGGLMKKIARQLTYSVRKPPTTGPIASASALTPAHVPIAVPRCSAGNAWVMIASVAGIMNAAPTPWTARKATRSVSLGANPIARLDRPNTVTPNRNILRRPKMSPRRPPVTSSTANVSVYAFTVHSRAASEACRSC